MHNIAYLIISEDGQTAANVFASRDDYAVVNDYQVSPSILCQHSAAALAELYGITMAEIVVPEIDTATTALTGDYTALKVGGIWKWVAQPRPLSVDEIAAALSEAKAVKVATLTAACAASISAGVVHDALGSPHTYPMSDKDQTNLLGRVAQAQMDPAGTHNLWCVDGGGVWAKRSHTAAQTIQVGLAAAAWVQFNSDKLSGEDGHGGLLRAVAQAATVMEVQAIVWG